MKLFYVFFLFFLINVTKGLERKQNSTQILSSLDGYDGKNPFPIYFGRRLNGPVNKRIQNRRRRGQNKDERPHHGWLSLTTRSHHEADEKRRFEDKPLRNRRLYTDESGRDSSTSREMQIWRQKFDEDWVREKQKALRLKMQLPSKAVLNMAGARPWSRPCGDPMQHDLPWGTCTLSFQCMPQLRIFRGDFQCGVTRFVCCGAIFATHDMYQGLDMSFIDTGSSSTRERAKAAVKSSRTRFNKRRREKIRRWKTRMRSKKRLKRMIKRLTHEIKKNLHRAFRNTSMDRKNKVKLMKKTIKMLKNKFRQQRLQLKNTVDKDIAQVDDDLRLTLANINMLNAQYLTNETFRGLLKKYNLTVESLGTLRSFPDELEPYVVWARKNSDDIKKEALLPLADARKFKEKDNETTDDVSKETATPASVIRVSTVSSVELGAYSELDGKTSDEVPDLEEIALEQPDNIVNGSETPPLETRRFRGGFLGDQRKHGKMPKSSEDYSDYVVEFGKLYY